ncbi:MAG: hypothetical protein HDR30_08290 [Lachnospiraceae bacterium]|nr:hypothetical protein [Lachnospiraceae bacterium]
MKCEDISDALGLLDENLISHTLMVRRKKKKKRSNRNKKWKVQYVAAASLCLVCVGAAATWSVLQHRSESNLPQEGYTLQEQPMQKTPEPEMPERFVEISSLLVSNDGNFIVEQTEKYATVPIEKYSGFYTEVSSADSSVLSESMGKSIDSSGEWHFVSGHSDLQYLIRNDEQGISLWKFQCFDSSEYPYNDVLKLVYQINSADAITEIEVAPARMDNTDGGKKIQEEIGTQKITDRVAIEIMYEMLSGMTCYGNGRWEMIDYGNVEAASDTGTQSHEAVRLGRYLSITTNYGNVIDGLKYTAVSDMFYEFSGIAYSPLTEEQAASVCEIIGIMKSEGEDGQSYDVKSDDGHRENNNSDDGAGTILLENPNTDVSLEYVTELQTKVSSAMMNHEVPFVISSSVYENPYRLHVVVTSNAEEDLQKLRDLDTIGGVLEIEYSPAYTNSLYELYEQKY